MAERWLEREIARGLQGLLALRLNGAPADDSVTLTLDVWLAALDSHAVSWSEYADAPRIQRAFRTLYRLCDRWPAPRHFLDNLGNRDPPPSLPAPRISQEERERNQARLREIRAGIEALARSKPMRTTAEEKE